MRRYRRGLSSVYGFIVIFMLLMAGLEAISVTIGTEGSISEAQSQARQLESTRQLEHLSISLNGTSLAVENNGLIPSTLAYLYQSSSTDSVDSRLGETLPAGASVAVPILTKMQRFAIVTSLGNVFVSTTALQAAPGLLVTFDVTGPTYSFGSSSILSVDGAGYNYSQLPKSFEWASGSVHSYSYAPSVPSGNGSRVGWSSIRGLATTRSGSLTVTQSGSVVSVYSLQYLLTVTGGNGIQFLGSPSNDGWYDAGTSAQVSSSYVWSMVTNESRRNLVSYSVDGSTPVGVARSGSGVFTSEAIAMDSPHALDLISTTQYHLSLGSAWSLAPNASLTFGWAYTISPNSSQGLQNPGFETGSLSSWSLGGNGGVESSVVHSGKYAAFINPDSCYGRDCSGCCDGSLSQSVAFPSGATLTSNALSVWYYIPTTNSRAATVSLNGIGCPGEPGVSGSAAGSWTELGYIWSGSCGNPGYLEVQISVLDHSTSDEVYIDDAVLSYSYVISSSGSTSSAVTAAATGGAVVYSFPFSYPFPRGAYGRSYTVAFPPSEALKDVLVAGGPSILPSTGYSESGSSVTIPDSTIGEYNNSFTLVTAATGAYSVSQSGSQTGDGWYDSGTSATLTASCSFPFSFTSWSGSPTLASQSQASTTVTMNSYYSVVGGFKVSQ